jgi:hypothetical protein
MKKCIVLLALAAILVSGCSSSESYVRAGFDFSKVEKVAVIDVIGPIDSDSARNQIADYFTMELLRKGFTPIERMQVQSLLKEQKFQSEGLTSSDEAVKAGKILNVTTVMIINVPQYQGKMSMIVKILNVEDGSILWLGSGSNSSNKTVNTVVGGTVGAVTGAVVGGKGNKTEGAVIGGAAGGLGGWLLTPEEAQAARSLIKDICKSLPSKVLVPKPFGF